MPIHTCNICKYETLRLSSFNKHLQSKKHNMLNKNKNLLENNKICYKTTNSCVFSTNKKVAKCITSNPYQCNHCNKSLSSKRNLQEHYEVCKLRPIEEKDCIISNLQKQNEILLKEKEEISKDLQIT